MITLMVNDICMSYYLIPYMLVCSLNDMQDLFVRILNLKLLILKFTLILVSKEVRLVIVKPGN